MEIKEKSLLFVYNPVSGKGLILDSLGEILNLFTRRGYRVTVHPTASVGDGHDYIASNAVLYDEVCVSGGDGMLNEAVSALLAVPEEHRPTLSYLPAGSTNDFASTVGIPTDPLMAANALENAEAVRLDAGTLDSRGFAYVAAFGAFTDVAYDTPQDIKNVFGHLAYVIHGLAVLPSIREQHLRVIHGDTVIEGDFLYGMVSNTKQVGGMKLTDPAISLADGKFEVLLIKPPKNAAEMQTLIGAIVGRTFNSDCIVAFTAKEVTVESENPISWTLDGEYGGETTLANIQNHHLAYSLLIPKHDS